MKAFYINPLYGAAYDIDIEDFQQIRTCVSDISFHEFSLDGEYFMAIRNKDQDSRFVSIASNTAKIRTFGPVVIMATFEEAIIDSLSDKQMEIIKSHLHQAMQENHMTTILEA